jgi:HTH-type transcriptional repressor of NAD biosynthesis genes
MTIKVCIFGPESTGKSTLAKNLAERFKAVLVPEYAEELIRQQDGNISYLDMKEIAKGQLSLVEAALKKSPDLLICDTDLITTKIWSHKLFGKCDSWVEEQAKQQSYDLYLLLDVDVPWVDDTHRYLPEDRKPFFNACKQELEKNNKKYQTISGSFEERLACAEKAVKSIF